MNENGLKIHKPINGANKKLSLQGGIARLRLPKDMTKTKSKENLSKKFK